MSAGDFKVFDLDRVTFAFLSIPLNGFGEGGAVKIEKVNATFDQKVGMDGTVVRVKKGDKLYKITGTFIRGALANAILSTILNNDEISPNGAGVGPLIVSDLVQGTSIFAAGKAWIAGPPVDDKKNESTDMEWIFYAADGVQFVGGN